MADPQLNPTPKKQTKPMEPAHGAAVIREGFGAAIMASAAGSMAQVVGPASFHEFRSQLIKDCRGPDDAIEKMMLDQLAWLHFRGGELIAASADMKLGPEHVAVLTTAAARLLAEFRKSSLALREYRSPIRQPPNLTVVTNSNTQVAVVDGQAEVRHPQKNSLEHELVSNDQAALAHERIEPLIPQRQTRASGTPKPREARTADRRRKTATPKSRIAMPPVVEVDGTADDGWLGAGLKQWIPNQEGGDDFDEANA